MGSKGGGGGNTTTVQKADPWVGVQPYLTQGYQQLANLYMGGSGPQYYPNSTVSPIDQLEITGRDMQLQQLQNLGLLGSAASLGTQRMTQAGDAYGTAGGNLALGGAGGLYGSAAGLTGAGTAGAQQGMNQLLAAGDVQNNPYFQGALSAAIRPVTEQFTEQVLPGIRQGAIGAGQMGSSRQGIAEGIASRGYLDTVGDITSQMGSQAYGQGLQAVQAGGQLGAGLLGAGLGAYGQAGQLGSGLFGTGMESIGRGVALAPTAQQAGLTPGQVTEGVGQRNTADSQAVIDADIARWNYQQQLPYTMMSDYLGILSGAPGGQTSSTMSGGGSNRLLGGLGGAATGYGLASALVPGYGWLGALGGGLLGLF